jgi:DnaJ-class molecular chaperone
MKPAHEVLGIGKGSSAEEAKTAYKRLASKYHPDKHPEAEKLEWEQKFKEIGEALKWFEERETGKTNVWQDFSGGGRPYTNSDMADILRAFAESHNRDYQNRVVPINLTVDLQLAFTGGTVGVTHRGRSYGFVLKAGLPQGSTFTDELPTPEGAIKVLVTTNFTSKEYRFLADNNGTFLSGDLEKVVSIHAATIMVGGHVQVSDLSNKTFEVRVPKGFDITNRLKLKGRGYTAYNTGGSATGRGDLYIVLKPTFKMAAMAEESLHWLAAAIEEEVNRRGEEASPKE